MSGKTIVCILCGKRVEATTHRQKYCKECKKAKMKEWAKKSYTTNREYRKDYQNERYYKYHDAELKKRKERRKTADCKEYNKKWQDDHPNYKREWRELHPNYDKEWRRIHAQVVNKARRIRYRTDLKYGLTIRVSGAIAKSLHQGKGGYHWEGLVGYTLVDLITHLSATMPEGYTWQDYLSGALEIDHVIPIRAFSFEKPEDAEFKVCWALKNLRLLPSKENRIKGIEI